MTIARIDANDVLNRFGRGELVPEICTSIRAGKSRVLEIIRMARLDGDPRTNASPRAKEAVRAVRLHERLGIKPRTRYVTMLGCCSTECVRVPVSEASLRCLEDAETQGGNHGE